MVITYRDAKRSCVFVAEDIALIGYVPAAEEGYCTVLVQYRPVSQESTFTLDNVEVAAADMLLYNFAKAKK